MRVFSSKGRLIARPLLLIVAGTACAADAGDGPVHEVRDSAGIAIVSTSLPDAGIWRVDSVPFLDIGTLEGEEGQDLATPWASRRLPDGRVVVANAQTNELRFYTAEGRFLRSAGGSGEGPGEFGLIAAIHRGPADTIIVADATLPRLNLFTSDGEFARTATIDPVEGRLPRLRGLAQRSQTVYRVPFYERGTGRAVRDTALVIARPLDGGATVEIGRFPAHERFNQQLPGGSIAGWPLPFGRGFHTAFSGDLLWIGVSDRYELLGYDRFDGSLRRIVRVDAEPTPVGDADRSRFFEHQLAGAETPEQRQMYLDIQAQIDFAPTFPAFSEMVGDSDGNLWIRDYSAPWDQSASVWRVYRPDGTGVARVVLPEGLDVHDIGADYVLGMWLDALDVEHIRAYRLSRGVASREPTR